MFKTRRQKNCKVADPDETVNSDEEYEIAEPQPMVTTMAAVIGTVTPFDGEEYSEVLDFFFEANGIADPGKQKAVLLSGMGASTYSLLRSLVSPQTPKDKTYTELTGILKAHLNPKPSEIMQRFKFNSRILKSGESVADYVAELKKLAQHCEYKEVCTNAKRQIGVRCER